MELPALYLVGTPIGNLGDITERARELLRSVRHVAAEDTRRTRPLLSHLGATGQKLHALDAHASDGRINALLDLVATGESVAYVTDAGMPCVSDPGTALVRAAAARGLRVEVLPGPSAVDTAIAHAALVDGPYGFLGFLPRKGPKRTELIEALLAATAPQVIYEAPSRMAETLAELAALAPDRTAVACRELTKLHEEVLRGTLTELAQRSEWRGELVLVVAGAPEAPPAADEWLRAMLGGLLASGVAKRDATAYLARLTGRRRSDLYRWAEEWDEAQDDASDQE